MTLRVGYGKMGRSVLLDPGKWGAVGGDNEPPMVLKTLAERNPDVEFWVTGRNSGEDPRDLGYPGNVINPWHRGTLDWNSQVENITEDTREARHRFMTSYHDLTHEVWESLDHVIVWTGQHGTSNLPIPKIGDRSLTTMPQISFVNYAGTMIHGINIWRDVSDGWKEETWLCPDPRNYVKSRDLKWPIRKSVVCQYEQHRYCKYERYGDTRSPEELGFTNVTVEPGVWRAKLDYSYDRLEIVGIPDDLKMNDSWDDRSHFGVIMNEARTNVTRDRLGALVRFILPLEPAFIHGKWSDKSLEKLQLNIKPIHHSGLWDKLRSTRTTFTTPSSGSGWATTKPWEAFACGVVCFFHPYYDEQGHIIPTRKQLSKRDKSQWRDVDYLARYLRVDSPTQLRKRVEYLNTDAGRSDWQWLVRAQRALFDQAVTDQQAIVEMEQRMRA